MRAPVNRAAPEVMTEDVVTISLINIVYYYLKFKGPTSRALERNC